MTNSPAPRPSRWRLQFSLRLLLLALTAFAIGFPIWYRWPYEETEYDYNDPSPIDPFAVPGSTLVKTPYRTTVTTWRRNWGGGKVRSGRSVTEIRPGSIRMIEHYDNDEQHGPLESYREGGLIRSGQYEHGQREGAWIDRNYFGTFTAHWHRGRLHGLYEIAPLGSAKQQFHFDMGRLIEWNGKPVHNRLVDQLTNGTVDNPRIVNELTSLVPSGMDFVETPLKDVVVFLQDVHNIPIVVDARRAVPIDRPITITVEGVDLCSGLTLLAAPNDLAFEYRYGVLFLTTAEHARDSRDPTGVANLRPPAGSPLARIWNEPYSIEFVETPLDDALKFIAFQLAVTFDPSALPSEGVPLSWPVTKYLKNLPFRHVLALFLDDLQLRCEIRGGDTLVILPQK